MVKGVLKFYLSFRMAGRFGLPPGTKLFMDQLRIG